MATSARGARRVSNADGTNHGIHEQKVSAAFRAQKLTAVPSDLLTLKNLVRIDLSMNQITRFPGQYVAAEMLRLEVLLLQDNLLYVFEDILALASAPRLRELDLQRNPLRLQNNRVYLLEALFSQRGSDESLLLMAHKDEQLKHHGSASDGADSRMRKTRMLRNPHTMVYRKRLPRKHGFPLLQRLNDEWITDAEITDVEAECGHVIEYFKSPAQAVNHKKLGTRGSKTGQPYADKHAGNGAAPHRADGRRFDGSRMTIKQMLKNEARSAGIPQARVIQRIQIDADNGDQVSLGDEARDDHVQASAENHSAPRRTSTRTGGATTRTDIGTHAAGGESHLDAELDTKAEEQSIIHRLFQPSAIVSEAAPSAGSHMSTTSARPEIVGESSENEDEELEPWNYSVSTFDTLNSEERQYVRYRSKQVGSTIERDDHFFDSSVFLDCVAQAERSRRLTVRAVDLLSQQQHASDRRDQVSEGYARVLRGSQSTPGFPTCAAAATLVDSMNAKFTKQLDQATYEKVLAFQEKQLSVDSLSIQAAVGDYYQSEHMLQKQRNNQVLSVQAAAAASHHPLRNRLGAPHSSAASVSPAATETTIEDSLSKLKLRNAVDLANTLLDPKQQKRMLQTLIDADEKVIEEERVLQDQTAHKYRLRLINARSYAPHDSKQIDELVRKANNTSESPWQRRNWKAIEVQQKQRQRQQTESDKQTGEPKRASSKLRPSSSSLVPAPGADADQLEDVDSVRPEVAIRFRSIETVERAARDALPGVNSHDLLVRCAEIRQHADKHVKALAHHRDRFLEDEAAWEHMRQDPTNLVRRHLKRRLYQHAQEVQIGSTQFFYSPLFSD